LIGRKDFGTAAHEKMSAAACRGMLSIVGVVVWNLNEMFHFLNIAPQRSRLAMGFLQVAGEG
jgi:hypothetical protein